VPERDDGFRRLDEQSPLDVRARARRETERVSARGPADLAPRGLGAVLDDGIDALRAHFLPCLGACVALWIVPAWLVAYWPAEEVAARFGTDDESAAILLVLTQVFHSILSSAVQVVALLLVGVLVSAHFQGERREFSATLELALRRFIPAAVCTLLYTLLGIAGMLACVLPYFFVLWRFSLGPLCTVLERDGPIDALQRSFRLTKGTFLLWLGAMVVGAILAGPFSGSAAAASVAELRSAALESLPISPATYAAVLWASATVFHALATALMAAISTSFYYECRVRRGGLDLRARLEALATARPEGASA
jgi:hypothetical protein